MKSYAYVRRNIRIASIVARFSLVVFLVFATFNSSYYSISTWIISGTTMLSVRIFVAFGLTLVWVILLRISLAGLGNLGLAYVFSSLLILLLMDFQFGFLRFVSFDMILILAQFGFAGVITFGLVFSYLVRQASGQSPVVKRPP